MKLTQEIKRMLDALALANAGDNLTRRQKSRLIAGKPAPLSKTEVPMAKTQQPQVGLYLGSELSADVMQYVVQTCTRLKHGLSVLSFQAESEVQTLLAPYQGTLAENGIEMRVAILTGEPPAALVHALRRRPEVAFLICNESGYLGRGLIRAPCARIRCQCRWFWWPPATLRLPAPSTTKRSRRLTAPPDAWPRGETAQPYLPPASRGHSRTFRPKSMLLRFFPFLRWFPLKGEALRGDLIAGVTVALILIPQSMAYATLAGLPVVYGLYAAFLPVMIASMWGASRFLHTGPVALLSLMSAAAIEPLASRGSDEFIQLSMTLALMVGVMRLALGGFRMGVLINLASHPVINGFTNAAALIIGLSLLNTFINVPMPRSDMFLRDLWHVLMQLHLAHWPTIAFGIGTLAVMSLLKRWIPKLPGVLAVVVLGTIVSAAVGFEKTAAVAPEQIVDAEARAAFEKYAQLETALASNKQAQGELRAKLATPGEDGRARLHPRIRGVAPAG
jgi:hypothetical protein